MKTCPYCGGEILETAKKCKHCGKWLEQKCPQCGEWVSAEAKKCRYCGYWFDPWQRRQQEKAEHEKLNPTPQQPKIDLESAIEEHEDNKQAGCILNIECGIIIVILGFALDWDWWQFGLGWLVGYILLNIHILRVLYCIAISLVWGFIGVALSPFLLEESDFKLASRLITEDYTDYWWMGLIFAVVSLFFHWPAMKSRFEF